MTILMGPSNADHYRVKIGRYGDRWYADPLPADDIAAVTDDAFPSVSTIKKAHGSDWTFVGLKRVALALEDDPRCLDGLDLTDRYERLKVINKSGLRKAQDRGTDVHSMFEAGLRGQPVDATFMGAEAQTYQRAVQAFLDHYQPETVAAEVVCINRTLNGYGYGGTGDALLRIQGSLLKVDWKSRGADSDHGAYPEEAGQVGGYADSEYIIVDGPKRMPMPALDGGLIVSVKPDGYRAYPIDIDKAKTHWRNMHAWWVARRDERDPIGKPWAPHQHDDPLTTLIGAALTVDELNALWVANQTRWTDELTGLARQRKAQLTAAA